MTFETSFEMVNGIAKITLSGKLDANTAPVFQNEINNAAAGNPKRLVLIMNDLEYMASAGIRMLVFAKQKMGPSVDVYIVGAQEFIKNTLEMTGFHQSVIMVAEYNAAEIENV